MRQDFTEVYDDLINQSFKQCCNILKIKLIAQKHCRKVKKDLARQSKVEGEEQPEDKYQFEAFDLDQLE